MSLSNESRNTLAIVLPVCVTILIALVGWCVQACMAGQARKAEVEKAEQERAEAEQTRVDEAAAAEKLRRQEARIERRNQQIQLLYGPLYARCISGYEAWETFKAMYHPVASFLSELDGGTNEEAREIWMLWQDEVFIPNNEEMVRLILANAHLLVGEFPDSFKDLVSYVKGQQGLSAEWKEGKLAHMRQEKSFPRKALKEDIEEVYSKLVKERDDDEKAIPAVSQMFGLPSSVTGPTAQEDQTETPHEETSPGGTSQEETAGTHGSKELPRDVP